MRTYLLPICLLLALCTMAPASYAASNSALTSITKFVDANSVFARYYAQYLATYGKNAATKEDAFRSFCAVLKESDLLAIEIVEMGIPATPLMAALDNLQQIDLASASPELIRNAIHTVDYALESVEFAFTKNHRSEFRREVLAQVPPITFSS